MVSRDIMRSTARDLRKYYSPVLNGELRLDTNTNVLGSNPAAMKFIRDQRTDLSEYPSTYSDGLRSSLADLYGLDTDNFVAGSGSDEMLDISFKTFTEWGDGCLFPYPSYSLYDYFAKINGCKVSFSDLTEDFQLDVGSIVSSGAKIVIIASPNNPTGNSFRQKDIEEILAEFKGIVIVDEAYGEYSDRSMIPYVNEYSNMIVFRTFSKAYAMAAMRVGYAAAGRDLADMMNAVKIPYSLNSLSEGAAIAALRDQDFVKKSREMVLRERPRLASGLSELGFRTYPSDSNFVLAVSPISHSALTDSLKQRGILIRDFGNRRRTENCVRFTVGTGDMNNRLLSAIRGILEECG
ncbi:MAG: histidinol-phosphate transaminase [Candidatus Methanoplasma sp.]|jgi:histidinol-phosphate aminotransferase|nr:histidinol-phosphate transaminase [Candidatus Methanoplasma sp.]